MVNPPDADAASQELAAWAACGAMAITGRADGPPLGPPAGLVTELLRIARMIERRSTLLGNQVEVDPLQLLTERAAIQGLHRQGSTSCGGATRLLEASDGWLAVSLARPDDIDLVPAWLRAEIEPGADPWAAVQDLVRSRVAADVVADGALLGLPVAALGEASAPPPDVRLGSLPVRAIALGAAPARRSLAGLRVVDLSSLWAGPLCASLLAQAGADVVKVESTSRPDGSRRGPAPFFDLLNAGKRSVAVDFSTSAGRRHLGSLVANADVVIEASRPRALAQLGIDAATVLAEGRPTVWASITGHGRGAGSDRTAFGDDAAVAGGLVAWDDGGPCFCADAVADPTTGLVTAAAVLEALAQGGRWLIDSAMAGVAAHVAGPTLALDRSAGGTDVEVPQPVARPVRRRGPLLGEHTDAVLSELVHP